MILPRSPSLHRLLFCTLAVIATCRGSVADVADVADVSDVSDVEEESASETIVASLEMELRPDRVVPPSDASDFEIDDNGEVPNCPVWASEGECEKNPSYMLRFCGASCASASVAAVARADVYDGEDGAAAAIRFAEEHGAEFQSLEEAAKLVGRVARELQDLLDADGYVAPRALTHCGKRPCTAGKLWNRAEELRKADVHDDAGADLLRALRKTGLEADFVERCERSLQRALGSVRQQREREWRRALEDEKKEAREEEERRAGEEAAERRRAFEADLRKFGEGIRRSLEREEEHEAGAEDPSEASVGPDGTVDTEEDRGVRDLVRRVQESFVAAGPQGGNWNATLQLLRKLRPGDKTTDLLLIEARCHDMLGDHRGALSAAGHLIKKAASHTSWIDDSPRMMAVTLGANAAMQLGLSPNALSFYQTVLQYDPEQQKTRNQYRGLKKVVKLMQKADEQIEKGYNRVAAGIVDDCLSAMRGLDVDSPLFRSKIQLKRCTILSGMGEHEEALANCDAVVELRADHPLVADTSKKEAYLARGEALLKDMDYDEAVQDFRAALDLVPDDKEHREERRELQGELQETQREQELWNGGRQDQRYNQHTGYPNGRPPERDHAKILQLPVDLDNQSQGVRCAWLKKQFKTLVRHYHPDKYKGNKKRGARKFNEVKMAREIISEEWDC